MERYENRYVAFIDILGFTNLIEQSERDRRTFEKVLGITQGLAEMAKNIAMEHGVLIDGHDIIATAFSDSIVISAPDTSDQNRIGSLYAVVFAIQGLCRKLLLDLNTLARGGLAVGAAYHKDGVLFGRSVIDAYKLERDDATVARVAVAPIVAQQWMTIFGNPRGLVALKDVVRQDHDGVYMVDLFHFPINDDIDNRTAEFFRRAGPILSMLLADSSLDRRALGKVAWVADQYNHSFMLRRLPGCSPVHIPS